MDTRVVTELTFEAFGVRLALHVDDPALLDLLGPRLPPGWKPSSDADSRARFGIASRDGFHYEVMRDEQALGQAVELDVAVAMLESAIRLEVAQYADGVAFIHAGAVAVDGRGLVLPGRSFAGKTTLVHELIRQGATYYSDEYALLDERGQMHPYAKLLSMRARDAKRTPVPAPTTETDPALLGAPVGDRPVDVALIASTTFVAGSEWQPCELSRSEGALMLLSHSVTVRAEPGRVMEVTSKAVAGARAIESERGEAAETATALLELLRG